MKAVVSKGVVSAVIVASGLAFAGAPARAGDRLSPGAGVALGILGGVAIGGAVAAASQGPGYYSGRPVYAPPPPPVVYAPPPPPPVYVEEAYGPACHWERRRFTDEYGDMIVRRMRVCD